MKCSPDGLEIRQNLVDCQHIKLVGNFNATLYHEQKCQDLVALSTLSLKAQF